MLTENTYWDFVIALILWISCGRNDIVGIMNLLVHKCGVSAICLLLLCFFHSILWCSV
jgi:hypothetical protein